MTEDSKNMQKDTVVQTPSKTPDDTGSIHVEGFVQIFDPATNEKFVEKRA